jgi:hypothetical protein
MNQAWTVVLMVAVAGAAGTAGFFYGRHRALVRGGAARGVRGPVPVIDPKLALAARVASIGSQPQKV